MIWIAYSKCKRPGRAEIFWSDDDRQRFLNQLAHHLHLAAVVLYAYVLMDNTSTCLSARRGQTFRPSCSGC